MTDPAFQRWSFTILFSAALAVLIAGCQKPAATKATLTAGKWEKMRDITPRHYLCHWTRDPITIDGRADEPAWQAAEWTQDFVDIEGDARPKPRFRTRAKMIWDDDNLYIYAELEEPHVWATIKDKNAVIFNDNDFEVFISPDGSNYHYHEFEMNALNTIWELTLDRPYRDHGPCHDPDNIPGVRTAVHVRGTLNDPRDTDQGWCVEIAFPWKGLAKYGIGMPDKKEGTANGTRSGPATMCPPREGDIWRMGFSRVEWVIDIIDGKYRKIAGRPEDNWIWSPQGIVDMHAPERWGFVQFTREPEGRGQFTPDPTWPAREALMEVYHRQREFFDQNKRYAASVQDLGYSGNGIAGLPPGALEIAPNSDGYLATVTLHNKDGGVVKLHTQQDSKLWREE